MHSIQRLFFFKAISWYLVFAMVVIGMVPKAYAGFVSSEAVNLSPVDRAADLQRIQKTLETKIVSQRLSDLGFSPDEIKTRIGQLSDQQIHRCAVELDQMKVAGDGLGLVIGILIIAILVVVLVKLLGHKIEIK
jgi:hypothetical protein